MTTKTPVITLDGPAGVGKSTLAAELAEKLAIPCLDTGAMFRHLALMGGERLDNLSDKELTDFCSQYRFSLSGAGRKTKLFCNGQELGSEIRSEKAGFLASRLGKRAPARAYLMAEQQRLGRANPLVAEGRDMGTVVFPDAKYKFFLDAAPETRAKRRWLELAARGEEADLAQLTAEIRRRDEQDRTRALAPLMPAPDSIVVDSTNLNRQEVLAKVLTHIPVFP